MLVQVDIQAVPNVLHLCQGRMAGWWGGAHQMRMVVCCCAQSLRNNPPGYRISLNNSCCAESERYLESQFGNTEFKDILRSWFCMERLFPVEICNFQWNGDVIFISESSSSIQCFILTLCWDSYKTITVYIYYIMLPLISTAMMCSPLNGTMWRLARSWHPVLAVEAACRVWSLNSCKFRWRGVVKEPKNKGYIVLWFDEYKWI